MKRRAFYWLLGLLLCWSAPAQAADGELRLVYAGNFGAATAEQVTHGVARIDDILRQSRLAQFPVLFLSPGNVTNDQGNTDAISALSLLAPAAVAVGPCETRLGNAMLRDNPLPWVSLIPQPETPVVPFRIITVASLRVGVIGLTLTPGAMPTQSVHDKLAATITKVRRQADLVILLGTFDAVQAPLLAACSTGVDIVLGGEGNTAPQKFGPTALAPLAAGVPSIGVLEVAIRDGHLAAWRGGIEAVK
ncbi:MAG: metallophosphoesterase family protein [Armatimonadota bacterium]